MQNHHALHVDPKLAESMTLLRVYVNRRSLTENAEGQDTPASDVLLVFTSEHYRQTLKDLTHARQWSYGATHRFCSDKKFRISEPTMQTCLE